MEQSRNIRLPVHVMEKLTKVTRASHHRAQTLERLPWATEIADQLGWSASDVEELAAIPTHTASLDFPVGEESISDWKSMIGDPKVLSPLTFTIQQDFRAQILRHMKILSPRETEIIKRRFGMGYEDAHTWEEIGGRFGITRERVRQIEAAALKKLRNDPNLKRIQEAYDRYECCVRRGF